jgi:hypothetical protein
VMQIASQPPPPHRSPHHGGGGAGAKLGAGRSPRPSPRPSPPPPAARPSALDEALAALSSEPSQAPRRKAPAAQQQQQQPFQQWPGSSASVRQPTPPARQATPPARQPTPPPAAKPISPFTAAAKASLGRAATSSAPRQERPAASGGAPAQAGMPKPKIKIRLPGAGPASKAGPSAPAAAHAGAAGPPLAAAPSAAGNSASGLKFKFSMKGSQGASLARQTSVISDVTTSAGPAGAHRHLCPCCSDWLRCPALCRLHACSLHALLAVRRG